MIRIAIDGPSGAGKSTVAKAVAQRLGIDYIDTGAMYRALGYKMKLHEVEPVEDERLAELLNSTEIDFSEGNIFLDGEIVNDRIRTPEISMAASACSALASVRKKLVEIQQGMAGRKSVVMDGRDIGTVVLPDAELKYFITASPEERAARRYRELVAKGQDVSYERILSETCERDHNDSTREVTPLRRADDAVLLDTTDMTAEEVINRICTDACKMI